MADYRIVIPTTGHVIQAFEVLERAKEAAMFHARRLAHPTYPPKIIVQRVGPDGRACKVWEPEGVTV